MRSLRLFLILSTPFLFAGCGSSNSTGSMSRVTTSPRIALAQPMVPSQACLRKPGYEPA